MVINDAAAKLPRTSTMSNTATTGAAVANPPSGKDDTASSITVNTNSNTKTPANFPPPKTDKPRPHVCTTCQRSFARLEHLKRHERSHTKEKPFECPECARCFARRDLLLRHQQKLHQTSTPSSRPRNRRESASGVTPAQARRKNSVAGVNAAAANNNAGNASMRPRANTISHVDGTAMHMIAAANANVARAMQQGHSRHPSLIGLPAHNMDHVFGGMSLALGQRGLQHGLSKLDTTQMNHDDFENGLRTAPPLAAFNPDFDFESFVFGSASTINPNALHYSDSPQSMALDQQSPFQHGLTDMTPTHAFDDNFDWVSGFEHQMTFQTNENAIDKSSPSAISTTSQSGISDVMVDGSNHPAPAGTSAMWQPSVMGPPQLTNPFAMDLNGSVFPDLLNGAPVSPQPASQKINDPYFSTPPTSLTSLSPSAVPGLHGQSLNQTLGFNAGPDIQPPLSPGNNGASPVTTITDATRIAIVNTLTKSQLFGGRKFSFASHGSQPPQSGAASAASQINLPSTQDLQRYVGSYLTFFHPHFPFLHIPTLSFDLSLPLSDDEGGVGGRGCLLLGISMIGALYEKDEAPSKEMFEMSKKMIFLFLEDRRKAEMARAAESRRKAQSGSEHNTQSNHTDDGSDTPLWLVQAMLLNVAYGHNVQDKLSTDIASTHCTALVSLAQAAGLLKQVKLTALNAQDLQMTDDVNWNRNAARLEHQQWMEWKVMEERKRTLYNVFVMSSLLVTAYNHAPALTNSEIGLDLPCDEEFFAAESSTAFFAQGGVSAAAHNTPTFRDALGELLHSNERHRQHLALNGTPNAHTFIQNPGDVSATKIKPSSFGSLLLIYALHNYIWETRQRHQNKVWTNEETEKMHRHIEPALRAWQVAWASNPHHTLERPNPFGYGPLSADAIPLLDLAYVRLFVELERAKERFWERDWEGLARELARGSLVSQYADESPESMADSNGTDPSERSAHDSSYNASPTTQNTSTDVSPAKAGPPYTVCGPGERVTSRREKHLRKASFFAADSLAMSDRLGMSFADCNDGRDLPLQAALCGFECLQVLAEWVATLQDRVGRYLGIIGRDAIDFGQMPAIMVLEEDDVKLLEKVQNIIASAEVKIRQQLAGSGMDSNFSVDKSGGYCPMLLRLVGMTLEKAGVWQVYYVMAQCCAAQATFAQLRAEKSVTNTE